MRWYALTLVALTPIAVDTQALLAAREVTAALDHVRFLSDDFLEGRGAGTRGHEIAARYVAAEFEEMGLEAPLGRYLHPVRIRSAQVESARTTPEFQRRNGAVTRLQ